MNRSFYFAYAYYFTMLQYVRLICDAKKSSDIGFVSCGTG